MYERGLTERARKAVDIAVLETLTQKDVLIKAGYSPKGANTAAARMFASVPFQRALTVRRAELAAKSEWTFTKNVEGAENLCALALSANDLGNYARGLELLARLHGYAKDRKEITSRHMSINLDLTGLTRGELERAVWQQLDETVEIDSN